MRAQHGAGKGEYGGVRAGRLAAHEKWLIAEEVRNGVDRSRSERDDFIRRVPSETMAVKRGPHLAPHRCDHERTDRRRHSVEKSYRAFAEIVVIHPPVVHDDPVELIFGHFLECPGDRFLVRIQTLIEVDVVFFLDMPADESRRYRGFCPSAPWQSRRPRFDRAAWPFSTAFRPCARRGWGPAGPRRDRNCRG